MQRGSGILPEQTSMDGGGGGVACFGVSSLRGWALEAAGGELAAASRPDFSTVGPDLSTTADVSLEALLGAELVPASPFGACKAGFSVAPGSTEAACREAPFDGWQDEIAHVAPNAKTHLAARAIEK